MNKGNVDLTPIQKIVKKRKFIGIYKTSSKIGEDVNQAFHSIIRDFYNKGKDKM